jgi:plasmid stabilization system protein ParE
MKYKIEIKEEARKDIIEASDWYAGKAPGLNFYFIEQLEVVIKVILTNPKTYKRVYKNFRQAALKKFPYIVVYEHGRETVIIYSIFHAKQHPRKKIRRLKP